MVVKICIPQKIIILVTTLYSIHQQSSNDKYFNINFTFTNNLEIFYGVKKIKALKFKTINSFLINFFLNCQDAYENVFTICYGPTSLWTARSKFKFEIEKQDRFPSIMMIRTISCINIMQSRSQARFPCPSCELTFSKYYIKNHQESGKCKGIIGFKIIKIGNNYKHVCIQSQNCTWSGRYKPALSHKCRHINDLCKPLTQQKKMEQSTQLEAMTIEQLVQNKIDFIQDNIIPQQDQRQNVAQFSPCIQFERQSASIQEDLKKSKTNNKENIQEKPPYQRQKKEINFSELSSLFDEIQAALLPKNEFYLSQKDRIEMSNENKEIIDPPQLKNLNYYDDKRLRQFVKIQQNHLPSLSEKCTMLTLGLLVRLCGSYNKRSQWQWRATYIDKQRFFDMLFKFYPWLNNSLLRATIEKAIISVGEVQGSYIRVYSFDNLLIRWKNLIQNITWNEKMVTGVFDRPDPRRRSGRIKRKDPQTLKKRKQIANYRYRWKKKFYKNPRSLTKLKYEFWQNQVYIQDKIYHRNQLFSNPIPFNHQKYYRNKQNREMISFSMERIADYLTCSFLLWQITLSQKQKIKANKEESIVFYQKKGMLTLQDEQEIKRLNPPQYHALTTWLPIPQLYLNRYRGIFYKIYQDSQYFFCRNIPPLTEDEVFENLVIFYRDHNLFRHETINELNDQLLNWQAHEKLVSEQIQCFEVRDRNEDQNCLLGSDQVVRTKQKGNQEEDIEIDVVVIKKINIEHPINTFFMQLLASYPDKEVAMDKNNISKEEINEQIQSCPYCTNWLCGQIVQCKSCRGRFHQKCWSNYCFYCDWSYPQLESSAILPLHLYPQEQKAVLSQINTKKRSFELLIWKQMQNNADLKSSYTLWNKFSHRFAFYPSYSKNFQVLSKQDYDILKKIQRGQNILPVFWSKDHCPYIVASRTIEIGELICTYSGVLWSEIEINLFQKKQEAANSHNPHRYPRIFKGPTPASTWYIVTKDFANFGHLAQVVEFTQQANAFCLRYLIQEGPIILLIAKEQILSDRPISFWKGDLMF